MTAVLPLAAAGTAHADFETMGPWGQAQGSGTSVQDMGGTGPTVVSGGFSPVAAGWGGWPGSVRSETIID
ncbi:hypothetical protein AB0P15_36620 [Streptomyces sp. NPDC087917]|uniref:hypothetical protein n=1 Tax=Streptomyces sp. NPDC087917 TaxID=3155060 RepID=UPI003444C563